MPKSRVKMPVRKMRKMRKSKKPESPKLTKKQLATMMLLLSSMGPTASAEQAPQISHGKVTIPNHSRRAQFLNIRRAMGNTAANEALERSGIYNRIAQPNHHIKRYNQERRRNLKKRTKAGQNAIKKALRQNARKSKRVTKKGRGRSRRR